MNGPSRGSSFFLREWLIPLNFRHNNIVGHNVYNAIGAVSTQTWAAKFQARLLKENKYESKLKMHELLASFTRTPMNDLS
jgi:hypothetical protein